MTTKATRLKLYSTDFSPFSTRVRIALFYKQIPFELQLPPGGVGSNEFRKISPLGNIPLLVDGNRKIAESSIILEYLEDKFPEKPLRPTEPWNLAQMRLQSRFTDLYLAPALYPLFSFLRNHILEDDSVEFHINNTREALAQLDGILGGQTSLCSRNIHLGDCVLAPSLHYVINIPPLYGITDILAGCDSVEYWWQKIQQQQSVARGLYETGRGFQAFLSNLKRPISEVN